jgi:hypothetical protein
VLILGVAVRQYVDHGDLLGRDLGLCVKQRLERILNAGSAFCI